MSVVHSRWSFYGEGVVNEVDLEIFVVELGWVGLIWERKNIFRDVKLFKPAFA